MPCWHHLRVQGARLAGDALGGDHVHREGDAVVVDELGEERVAALGCQLLGVVEAGRGQVLGGGGTGDGDAADHRPQDGAPSRLICGGRTQRVGWAPPPPPPWLPRDPGRRSPIPIKQGSRIQTGELLRSSRRMAALNACVATLGPVWAAGVRVRTRRAGGASHERTAAAGRRRRGSGEGARCPGRGCWVARGRRRDGASGSGSAAAAQKARVWSRGGPLVPGASAGGAKRRDWHVPGHGPRVGRGAGEGRARSVRVQFPVPSRGARVRTVSSRASKDGGLRQPRGGRLHGQARRASREVRERSPARPLRPPRLNSGARASLSRAGGPASARGGPRWPSGPFFAPPRPPGPQRPPPGAPAGTMRWWSP